MLKWYQLTPHSDEALRNVFHTLRKRRLMARKQDSNIIVCASDHHQLWLSNLCRDFNSSMIILDQAPEGIRVPKKESYVAPCGEEFFDPHLMGNHVRWCPKCKELAPPKAEAPEVAESGAVEAAPSVKAPPRYKVPRTYRKPRAPVVAKLEPGVDFNLDGIISSVEVVKDQLWEKVEYLDTLLVNLKYYRDDKEKITELSVEADKRVAAVKLLISEGKLPNSSPPSQ